MRIAIVNDMPLSITILRRVIESVSTYKIAWIAADGADAVRKAVVDRPDAILMDLVMPIMDGAEATRQIMAKAPCPILIVTSSVQTNHSKVYDALSAGGLDAVRTPTLLPNGSLQGTEPILSRLQKILVARGGPTARRQSTGLSSLEMVALGGGERSPQPTKIVVIGASTGGPEAVARVLERLGTPLTVPVVVILHIGPEFASGLAEWLTIRTKLPVVTASVGEIPQPGRVYVAVSDDHLVLTLSRRFQYISEPREYPYRPSVDVFFQTVRINWPEGGVAALLTGMGYDGGKGLLALRRAGWHTIAQDESTSVMFGMPKTAIDLGAAVEVLPIDMIGGSIEAQIRKAKAN